LDTTDMTCLPKTWLSNCCQHGCCGGPYLVGLYRLYRVGVAQNLIGMPGCQHAYLVVMPWNHNSYVN